MPRRPLPDDFEPAHSVSLPGTAGLASSSKAAEEKEAMEEEEDIDDYRHYASPEQLALELVTLSLVAESRWKNLVNLDIIRQRNKPKEAPRVPKLAPFFLPTVANAEGGFSFSTSHQDAKSAVAQV